MAGFGQADDREGVAGDHLALDLDRAADRINHAGELHKQPVAGGFDYAAAVLSRLCARVVSIEREAALAEHASATLRRLGFDNVAVAVGDGSLGWPSAAPYNVILVAAAADEVPAALTEQLAEGGRMVIPVVTGQEEPQDLRIYQRKGHHVSYRSLFPVLFVPLRTG